MVYQRATSLLLGLLASSTVASPSPLINRSASVTLVHLPPVDQVQSISTKPISFGLSREAKQIPLNHVLRRRNDNDDINVEIYNFSSVSYNIALDIGTPAQTVKVIIDTGSSELWVNPNCNRAQSQPQQQQCFTSGHYDVGKSSSGKVSTLQSQIQYGIGAVSLTYVSDDISIPGSDVKLEQVTFGDAKDSHDMNQGILGLSFGYKYNMGYRSIMDELVDQNTSYIHGFGMALGALDKFDEGVLTFGGVDTKKFSGKLHTEPIIPPANDQELWRYWVQLGSVGLTLPNQKSGKFKNSSLPVFFDSGSTLSYLPSSIVVGIAQTLGATYDNVHQMYSLACDTKGTVDFAFGDYPINVPVSDFLWDIGNGRCYLGVEASDTAALLGDSFLRSVYAVYDMDTPAIHFAPYINCGSNTHMIPAGPNKTAEFVGECESPTESVTSPSQTSVGNTSRSISGDQTSGGSGKNSDSSADRPIQSALMAVAVAVGVLAVIM